MQGLTPQNKKGSLAAANVSITRPRFSAIT
jgi:hypothetical protein